MMHVVRGIYLPNDDTHFPDMLKRAPMVDGRGTYQLNKATPAIRLTENKLVALDIGAHVGLWSMTLSKHFRTVHAFEPSPAHIECFRMNLNHRKNVHLHEFALGNSNGIAGFVPVAGNSGNAHLVNDMGEQSHDCLVNLNRLDDIARSLAILHADFIKIDVEGYEWNVVSGAENFIRLSKPVMVVEQKPGNAERYGNKTGEVIDLLQSWGARVEWEKSGDFCLKWGTGNASEVGLDRV